MIFEIIFVRKKRADFVINSSIAESKFLTYLNPLLNIANSTHNIANSTKDSE